jgi:hypothetical protein
MGKTVLDVRFIKMRQVFNVETQLQADKNLITHINTSEILVYPEILNEIIKGRVTYTY